MYTYMLNGSDERQRQFVPQHDLNIKYRIDVSCIIVYQLIGSTYILSIIIASPIITNP